MERKIIKFDEGNVRLENVKIPKLDSKSVLIRNEYTLISSGTEKACLLGEENSVNVPKRFGYSSVGYIEAVGSSVENVKVGDRVFAIYTGHTNYSVKPSTYVWKLPDDIDFEDAIFTKLASFPLLALRKAKYSFGESVVIVGTGLLGLLGVKIASNIGATPLIAIGGSRKDRLLKAQEFGAQYVYTSSDDKLTSHVISDTASHSLIKGANIVIETSGNEDGLLTALKYVSREGRIVLNGCNRIFNTSINYYKDVHLRGISIIGANSSNRPSKGSELYSWTTRRDYKLILEWMSDGRMKHLDLISEYANPSDCANVYDRLLNDREFPLGVVFDWTKI